MQAQGNNTNYVQYIFGTAANPATSTFDARFYFNPNGNASLLARISLQPRQERSTATFASGLLFHVRYRLNAGQPQVQIQVGSTANASWVNITNQATGLRWFGNLVPPCSYMLMELSHRH